MDSREFFRRSGETHHGVAIREFDGESLVPSGTGSDRILHAFVRVVPRWVAQDSGSRIARRSASSP